MKLNKQLKNGKQKSESPQGGPNPRIHGRPTGRSPYLDLPAKRDNQPAPAVPQNGAGSTEQ